MPLGTLDSGAETSFILTSSPFSSLTTLIPCFREVPAYLQLVQLLQQPDSANHCHIDALLVDGFGALHPRRAGSATQLGVEAGLPCIGVGKSLSGACTLREREVVAAMDERALLQLDISSFCAAETGAFTVHDNLRCVALRKDLESKRPVFVTVSRFSNPELTPTFLPMTISFLGRPYVQHQYGYCSCQRLPSVFAA
jgi:hypothetical protein